MSKQQASDGSRGETSSRPSAKGKAIEVAVRCRPPTNDEARATNARTIVKIDHVRRAVTVKEKAFVGFDYVYDRKATQKQVYEDLVLPKVESVLQGYNATVFAYGQTGTGKTFTIEGEHPPSTGSWRDIEGLGIIPRAVDTIFTELEKGRLEDSSVRISYLELYNEELLDLLAPTPAPDSGAPEQRLRIYDDPVKKQKGAIVIQGLEEVPVKGRGDVYTLLRKGAERRQTAATLMNTRSSRSHAVFTIAVVSREQKAGDGPNVEEVLKMGKLHLVDLAGSENVGRSGATDVRLREAGSINQSLLTLGRVITALTTSAAHIPYRESKLTRILQDSLGGRTITTIICTISPSSLNTEETLSALDYAHRAQNIRNHPEVNTKVSRTAFLKEHMAELERLRRDLNAAWEKNGVTISRENYEGMTSELNAQRERIEELIGQLDVCSTRMAQIIDDNEMMDVEYRRLYSRHAQLERKLEERRREVEELKRMLEQRVIELEQTRHALLQNEEAVKKFKSLSIDLVGMKTDVELDAEQLHVKATRLATLYQSLGDTVTEQIGERATAQRQILADAIAFLRKQAEEGVHEANAKTEAAGRHARLLGTLIDGFLADTNDAVEKLTDEATELRDSQMDAAQKATTSLADLHNQATTSLHDAHTSFQLAETAHRKQDDLLCDERLGEAERGLADGEKRASEFAAGEVSESRRNVQDVHLASEQMTDDFVATTLAQIDAMKAQLLAYRGNVQQRKQDSATARLRYNTAVDVMTGEIYGPLIADTRATVQQTRREQSERTKQSETRAHDHTTAVERTRGEVQRAYEQATTTARQTLEAAANETVAMVRRHAEDDARPRLEAFRAAQQHERDASARITTEGGDRLERMLADVRHGADDQTRALDELRDAEQTVARAYVPYQRSIGGHPTPERTPSKRRAVPQFPDVPNRRDMWERTQRPVRESIVETRESLLAVPLENLPPSPHSLAARKKANVAQVRRELQLPETSLEDGSDVENSAADDM